MRFTQVPILNLESMMTSMKYWISVCIIALALCLSAPQSGFAEKTITTGEKATLQAAMKQHIKSQLVGGIYSQVILETGKIRRLHPAAAHPMILRLEKMFILCTNFRDDEGRNVNVDFYLVQKGRTYSVVRTVIGDHTDLDALVKSGKAKIVN